MTNLQDAVDRHRQQPGEVEDTGPDEQWADDAACWLKMPRVLRTDDADVRKPRHRESSDHHVGDTRKPDSDAIHGDADGVRIVWNATDVEVGPEHHGVTD